MPSAGVSGRHDFPPSSVRNSSVSVEATIRSGFAGSTSKSIISPRGVNSSVNVLPPSLEISIADRTASNA